MRLCLAIFLGVLAAQAPDVQKIGPPIGARVPAFSLSDQFDRTQTLQSLTKKNGLMLVFFRSADW